MEVQQPDFGGRRPIDAYGDGGFRLGGRFHQGSLLLLPDADIPLTATVLAELDATSMQPLISRKNELDFVLIGCGATIGPVPAQVRNTFEQAGIAIDFMDTGAACRTYNVLLAEDRQFAALLMAVS